MGRDKQVSQGVGDRLVPMLTAGAVDIRSGNWQAFDVDEMPE